MGFTCLEVMGGGDGNSTIIILLEELRKFQRKVRKYVLVFHYAWAYYVYEYLRVHVFSMFAFSIKNFSFLFFYFSISLPRNAIIILLFSSNLAKFVYWRFVRLLFGDE